MDEIRLPHHHDFAPAASAPVAFAANGLPVGMQIVGHYGAELEVLQLVHAVQLPLAERMPSL